MFELKVERTMSKSSKRRMIDGDRLLTQLNEEFQKAQTCNPNDPWLPGLGLAACMVRDLIDSTDVTCNFRNPGWEERAKESEI